jgi:hypothetical protein
MDMGVDESEAIPPMSPRTMFRELQEERRKRKEADDRAADEANKSRKLENSRGSSRIS